ncbi:MAG: rhodanese-like domain-containing protein [Desulfovibrionaceae bacterium]
MHPANANAQGARRLFELTVLHEASRELAGLSTPDQIARSFLLNVMGAMGAGSGFIALFGAEPGEGDFVHHRGLGSAQAERLAANLSAIKRDWFANTAPQAPPEPPHILSTRAMGQANVFPADTRIFVRWTQDAGRGGLLGIGPCPAPLCAPDPGERGRDEEDRTFLLNLMACLQAALSRAWLTGRLAGMSRDLSIRNADLDRRVFQQDSLIQALSEMSGLTSPQPLMESFLLFLMGAAGASEGYALLLDKGGERSMAVFRGIDPAQTAALDPNKLRQVVIRGMFSGGGARTGRLDDEAELAACGLPAGYPGVWFVTQDNAYGFAGLRGQEGGLALDDAQRETVLGVAGAFLACLSNVLLLEALRLRNAELEATLEQVTSFRIRVDGLEKAKARIKEMVASEMGRVSRASWADFATLLFVSAAVGLLFNLASPAGVSLIPAHWSRPATPQIAVRDAAARVQDGAAVIVDARPPERFKQEHIAGAINLTPPLFDFMYGMRLARLPKEKPVLVYGRTISKLYDEEVADLLVKRGHTAVTIVTGGLSAWKKQGLPVRQ